MKKILLLTSVLALLLIQSCSNLTHNGLELQNVIVDGAESPDKPGNSVVSTSRYSMTKNYNLFIKDCSLERSGKIVANSNEYDAVNNQYKL